MNAVFYISKVYILHVCVKQGVELGLYSYIVFFKTGWNSGCIHNIVCLRQGGGTLAVLSHTNTGWIYTKYGYPIDSMLQYIIEE